MALEAANIAQILHPETTDKNWLDLVKKSFASHILTHETAYIVVENEAQKAALLQKHKQTLNGNKALDTEETQRMSEPSIWVLGLLLAVFMYWKRKKVVVDYF